MGDIKNETVALEGMTVYVRSVFIPLSADLYIIHNIQQYLERFSKAT